jgi:hypothetical protein
MSFWDSVMSASMRASKGGRNLTHKQKQQDERKLYHNLINIQDTQAHRAVEDPREQAHLNQSMWGRGLGKSTIATQDMERLKGIQGRRNAALERQALIAAKEISLYKKYWRHKRRRAWLATVSDSANFATFGIGMANSVQGGTNNNNNAQPVDTGGNTGYNYGDYNMGGAG